MLEKQIEASFGKKVNIETQIMALQSAAANKDIMEAMKKGKDALASHVNDEQLDKVADLIDDIEEHVNLVDEVDEALSRPVGKMMDDGELEDELAELEEQLVDEDLAEAPLTVPPVKAKAREEESKVGMDLPAAPAASVKKPMSKEEEELAALEAELV
jgi:charged multivesicular body protein 4